MMLYLGLTCASVLICAAAVIPQNQESKLAQATNDLALDLLRSYKNEKNVFISPFSISTALAMVYLGADGATAQAMRSVLKYDQYELTPDEVNQGFQFFLSRVRDNTADYQMSSYNSALVQDQFSILESYKQSLEQYYSATTENVDFVNQGEQVKAKINAAVGSATRGKITEFLDDSPSPDTKMFLLNAVYFLGNWEKPFNPHSTSERLFYNNGMQEKKIQMMTRDGSYRYTRSNNLKATVVVLPYRGNNSANFIVVLPDNKTGVAQLEQALTQDSFNDALRNARARRIKLTVPKFSLGFKADLKQPLTRLGLGELFEDNANLSRIAGPQIGLKVSSATHKAVIDVNEEGTEAAAATGIEAVFISKPYAIKIDHPFLFFIQDTRSGMFLFSGRVEEL